MISILVDRRRNTSDQALFIEGLIAARWDTHADRMLSVVRLIQVASKRRRPAREALVRHTLLGDAARLPITRVGTTIYVMHR